MRDSEAILTVIIHRANFVHHAKCVYCGTWMLCNRLAHMTPLHQRKLFRA